MMNIRLLEDQMTERQLRLMQIMSSVRANHPCIEHHYLRMDDHESLLKLAVGAYSGTEAIYLDGIPILPVVE